jgi:hypothetical protein
MKTGNRSVHVTRREFYGSLCVLWVYIMGIVNYLMDPHGRLVLFLLFYGSFAVSIVYLVMALRSPATGEAAERPGDPPDGVRR